jgi:tRNA threonylcarbamoyladenosine biosynthesis protein TsaB
MILGIETSGKLCSIAWYADEQLLLEYNVERENIHSTILAELFQMGMNFLNKKNADISLAAIGVGPGSYTGLRIGMSFLKGLCYGAEIPIVGISNFNVLALQACSLKKSFITLINANREKYYYAVFKNKYVDFSDKGIADISKISKFSKNFSGVVLESSLEIESDKNPWNNFDWIMHGNFRAFYLCKAAFEKFNTLGTDNLNELEPLYLQAFAGIL